MMKLLIKRVLLASVVLGTTVPALAVEHVVRMAGMNFQPASLQARIGDVVRFVNDDGSNHEILVPTKGFGVDLGMQKPSENTELTLRKAGSFEVECVVHPHMVMMITVKE